MYATIRRKRRLPRRSEVLHLTDYEKKNDNAGVPSVEDIFNEDDYMLEDDYLEASAPSVHAGEVKAAPAPAPEAAPAPAYVQAPAAPAVPVQAPVKTETAIVPKQQQALQGSRKKNKKNRRTRDVYVPETVDPESVVIVEVPQKDKKLVNISEHFSSQKISPIENAFYTISLIKPTAIFAEAAINGVAGIFDKMIDSRYQVNVKFKKIEANVKPTDTQPGVEPKAVTIASPESGEGMPRIESPKDLIPQ